MQKDYSSTGQSRLDRSANQTDPSPWTVVAQNMNLRAKPPRPASARWATIRLVLSLLPGVAISASSSVAPETAPPSRPYLAAIGSPALRFGEAPPPPDVRPAAGAPPQPHEDIAASAAEPVAADTSQPVTEPSGPAVAAPETKAAPVKTPPAILPDDTRSKVRAEDFLPYFQFPGSAPATGDVTVLVPGAPAAPTAAPLPASSATYRQQ